jgi:hypothetical protein
MPGGDGLRRPLNAPDAGDLFPGVQPGVQPGVVIANVVIVSGPAGQVTGIFVYAAGTVPGPGNPPIAWITNASTDPFGNAVSPQLGVRNAAGQGVNLKGSQLIFLGSNTYSGGGGGSAAYFFATPAATVAGQSVLFLVGPTDNALQAILQLIGESDDGTQQPYASLFQFNLITQSAQGGVPFALNNVSAEPGMLAGAAVLYAFGGHLKYAATDTNTYSTGRLRLEAAGQTLSSLTAVTITGLSAALAAGTYAIRVMLCGLPAVAAGTHTFGLTFTGAATCKINGKSWQTGAGGAITQTTTFNVTALPAPNFTSPAHVASPAWTEIDGEVIVTAAGTFTVTGLVSVAADTMTVNTGSFMEIMPVA